MEALTPERTSARVMYSLIFPTYNPGPAIERTAAEVSRFLEHAADWEVLFVCDGCTDDSVHRLNELFHGVGQVRVLAHAPNRGKGHAVRRGLAAARGEWRLFTDVDLAYGFDEIRRLAGTLRAGAEVAIASRFHPQSRLVIPPAVQGYVYRRYLQSVAFSALVRAILPIRQRDTQAGLKGMSSRAAAVLLPHLQCDGFAFDCELLAWCACLDIPVTEIPVFVRYETNKSTTSSVTMGRLFRSLWTIRRNCRALSRPVGDAAGAFPRIERRAA